MQYAIGPHYIRALSIDDPLRDGELSITTDDIDQAVIDYPAGVAREMTAAERAEYVRQQIPPVTARQMLVAMDEAGLLDSVEAYVATQPRVAQITWNRAQEFERSNDLLNAGAAGLGMTPEQVDDLFALARTK